MANEEDESEVNSLSPSTINIKKTRRVNYSVDPGNEGSQSSTSVPSEGEALGNVVDVENKIKQLIKKHQEIEKHKWHCEELNSALYLSQKYNKNMLQFSVK